MIFDWVDTANFVREDTNNLIKYWVGIGRIEIGIAISHRNISWFTFGQLEQYWNHIEYTFKEVDITLEWQSILATSLLNANLFKVHFSMISSLQY